MDICGVKRRRRKKVGVKSWNYHIRARRAWWWCQILQQKFFLFFFVPPPSFSLTHRRRHRSWGQIYSTLLLPSFSAATKKRDGRVFPEGQIVVSRCCTGWSSRIRPGNPSDHHASVKHICKFLNVIHMGRDWLFSTQFVPKHGTQVEG